MTTRRRREKNCRVVDLKSSESDLVESSNILFGSHHKQNDLRYLK